MTSLKVCWEAGAWIEEPVEIGPERRPKTITPREKNNKLSCFHGSIQAPEGLSGDAVLGIEGTINADRFSETAPFSSLNRGGKTRDGLVKASAPLQLGEQGSVNGSDAIERLEAMQPEALLAKGLGPGELGATFASWVKPKVSSSETGMEKMGGVFFEAAFTDLFGDQCPRMVDASVATPGRFPRHPEEVGNPASNVTQVAAPTRVRGEHENEPEGKQSFRWREAGTVSGLKECSGGAESHDPDACNEVRVFRGHSASRADPELLAEGECGWAIDFEEQSRLSSAVASNRQEEFKSKQKEFLEGLGSDEEKEMWKAAMSREMTDDLLQYGAEGNRARRMEYEDRVARELHASLERRLCALKDGSAEKKTDSTSADADSCTALETTGGVEVALVDFALQSVPEFASEALTKRYGDQGLVVLDEVLLEPRSMGLSLDLVGAWLKCYEIDKVDRALTRLLPLCREIYRKKGFSPFLVRALFLYGVCTSKQGRHHDSLACLEEVERVTLGQDWNIYAQDFFRTLYHNMGWQKQLLGRSEEALACFRKCLELKRIKGEEPNWWDYWDLGRFLTMLGRTKLELQQGLRYLKQSLYLLRSPNGAEGYLAQMKAMEAKVFLSLGECEGALGDLVDKKADGEGDGDVDVPSVHYERSCAHFREAHRLLAEGRGRRDYLTGTVAARSLGDCLLRKVGRPAESKEFLFDALVAASRQQSDWGIDLPTESGGAGATGEIAATGSEAVPPALLSVAQVVASLLEAARLTEDRDCLMRCFKPLWRVFDTAKARGCDRYLRVQAPMQYDHIVAQCAMIFVASGSSKALLEAERFLDCFGNGVDPRGRTAEIRGLLAQSPVLCGMKSQLEMGSQTPSPTACDDLTNNVIPNGIGSAKHISNLGDDLEHFATTSNFDACFQENVPSAASFSAPTPTTQAVAVDSSVTSSCFRTDTAYLLAEPEWVD